jgi:hypothetical protein
MRFAFVKLPVLEKFRPRYVNSLTIPIAFPSYEKLIFWGNQPLVYIELRMINFLSKMVNGNDSKIANILYKYMFLKNSQNQYKCKISK